MLENSDAIETQILAMVTIGGDGDDDADDDYDGDGDDHSAGTMFPEHRSACL